MMSSYEMCIRDRRRIELICNSLILEKDIELFTDINIKFANTLPQNVYELSQTIKNLSPYLSNETLLNQLPFIDNAKEAVSYTHLDVYKRQQDARRY